MKAFILLSLSFFVASIQSAAIDRNVCTTAGCQKLADFLNNVINFEADPCVDFYNFTCGKWIQTFDLTDRYSFDTFDHVQEKINKDLLEYIEKPYDSANEAEYVKKMKDYYHSCVDINTLEKRGFAPIVEALDKVGKFSILDGDNFDSEKFDWLETLIKMSNTGILHEFLINLRVAKDFTDNSKNVFHIDQIHIWRDQFLNGFDSNHVKTKYDAMVKISVILGARKHNAEKEIRDLIEFKMELAQIAKHHREYRNLTNINNRMTVNELQSAYPNINWLKYMQGVSKQSVNGDDIVIVYFPDYLHELNDILARVDKRTLSNYMYWTVAKQNVDYLDGEFREIEEEFIQSVYGVEQQLPRSEWCLNDLHSRFGVGMSSIYLKNFFPSSRREQFGKIYEHVRQIFYNYINGKEFMDAQTKAKAIEKLNSIKKHLAYTDSYLDQALVNKYYEQANIDAAKFFENHLAMVVLADNKMYNKMKNAHSDDGEYFNNENIAIVNAYYVPLANAIEIPAAFLNFPFFDEDRPNYLNLATMTAHEFAHTFDPYSRQLNGDLVIENWLQPNADAEYNRRAHELETFYRQKAYHGYKVDAKYTDIENVADISGIYVQYVAHKKLLEQDPQQNQYLPGLSYSPDQLYFINAAIMNCARTTPEAFSILVRKSHESPSQLRVNGAMQMISSYPEEQFADVFNCPANSPMNPKEKHYVL